MLARQTVHPITCQEFFFFLFNVPVLFQAVSSGFFPDVNVPSCVTNNLTHQVDHLPGFKMCGIYSTRGK